MYMNRERVKIALRQICTRGRICTKGHFCTRIKKQHRKINTVKKLKDKMMKKNNNKKLLRKLLWSSC